MKNSFCFRFPRPVLLCGLALAALVAVAKPLPTTSAPKDDAPSLKADIIEVVPDPVNRVLVLTFDRGRSSGLKPGQRFTVMHREIDGLAYDSGVLTRVGKTTSSGNVPYDNDGDASKVKEAYLVVIYTSPSKKNMATESGIAPDSRTAWEQTLALAEDALSALRQDLGTVDEALQEGRGGLHGISALIERREKLAQELSEAERKQGEAKAALLRERREVFAKDRATLFRLLDNGTLPEAAKQAAWTEVITKWKVLHAPTSPRSGQLIWEGAEPEFIALGRVEITSEPSGAQVISEGKELGTTPLRLDDVILGERSYTLSLEGYLPKELSGEVTIEEKLKLTAKMEKFAPTVATKKNPFENSLGQKFVPVPGTSALFCVWETRVQDYEAFVKETRRVWSRVDAGSTHPAVKASWNDAQAFCAWLTKKERAIGLLDATQKYRLPQDAEWSIAVGLKESFVKTPQDKDGRVLAEFPWGKEQTPPQNAGNYGQRLKVDSFVGTAPVGSFSPNRFGLYDLGGNIWEMCSDWYNEEQVFRVLRGGSFGSYGPSSTVGVNSSKNNLLSSFRSGAKPNVRGSDVGFRVVLDLGDSARLSDGGNPAIQSSGSREEKPRASDYVSPKIRSTVKPIYPWRLLNAGIQGKVVVEFVIDTNGDVRNAFAVRSTDKAFEQPAIEAVSKWKFHPARKSGRVVSKRIHIPVFFKLSKDG